MTNNEIIRLQMMKENCNPESGYCDGFCRLCKNAIESAIGLLNENKLIYYEIIEDVEGGFRYGGYETVEIAKEFLPKDKSAHIEKVIEIREVVEEEKQGERPMTNEKAIQYNKNLREYMRITDKKSEYKFLEGNYIALDMAIKALKSLDKLDEIITEQIDISNNQVECQTLRWVLDKMSEVGE